MKKHALIYCIFGLIIVLSLVNTGLSQEKAVREECEAKVREAVTLIGKIGAEAAFKIISDPDGPFVGKNTHVFCINAEDGTLLAHKISMYVGFNMHGYLDADKQRPYSDILEIAKTKDNGWKKFMSVGTRAERRAKPELKNMFFSKVPGKMIVVCAGYWGGS